MRTLTSYKRFKEISVKIIYFIIFNDSDNILFSMTTEMSTLDPDPARSEISWPLAVPEKSLYGYVTNLANRPPLFYKFTFVIVEACFHRFTYLRKYSNTVISVEILKNLLICELD
jgi:hypothetical protein